MPVACTTRTTIRVLPPRRRMRRRAAHIALSLSLLWALAPAWGANPGLLREG